jgi:hypothetical protein
MWTLETLMWGAGALLPIALLLRARRKKEIDPTMPNALRFWTQGQDTPKKP